MLIRKMARAAALGCVLASAPLASDAQVYKWTDEDGRVIVSDTPPPGKAKVQQIRKGSTAGASEESATGTGQSGASEKTEKAAKDNEKKPEKKSGEPEAKKILLPVPPDRATCNLARQNLQALESGAQLNTQGPGGERIMMDEAARARELARVRDTLRNCQN